tara:strand:+ start:248 stop:370 length:123 start_codon:yes stop_codon:yes gene_type:complete
MESKKNKNYFFENFSLKKETKKLFFFSKGFKKYILDNTIR